MHVIFSLNSNNSNDQMEVMWELTEWQLIELNTVVH